MVVWAQVFYSILQDIGIGGVQRRGRAWAGTVRDGFARRRVLVSPEGGYNWKRPRGGGRNQEELGTLKC